MCLDEAKRLRQLELENTRLKKILAERDLDVKVVKEIACPISHDNLCRDASISSCLDGFRMT